LLAGIWNTHAHIIIGVAAFVHAWVYHNQKSVSIS